MNSRIHLLILTVCLVVQQAAQAAGDPQLGKILYQARCASCHSAQFNGVGPAHAGVFGRKAASVDGYVYSTALTKAGFVWNEKLLDAWLRKPEKLVPGQKMGVSVPTAQERADLIAYLKTMTSTSH